jgi:hypothetical protein
MLPQVPNTVKLHRRGSCVPTVIACLPQLKDDDCVIEGWVRFGNHGPVHQHTWMMTEEGVFDPSLVQFAKLKSFPKPLQRTPERVMTVSEYRCTWRGAISPWWIDRCRSFGVIV